MRALYIIVPILCILVIAYRYYSAFIAARILVLDDSRPTPAHTRYDGHNFYPTTRWVLFGHHFAAITGAGPLVGPVLAAQFGYAPGFLWLVAGVVLAGAVHDLMILWASTRRGGRSLAEIAHEEIGAVAGVTTGIAVIFIIIIALAGLGLVVVNALSESAWGTFTIGTTIPLAMFMGLYMYRFRKGRIREATVIGVIGLLCAVAFGKPIAASSLGWMFTLTQKQLVIAMGVYGFFASVLPVWLLLAPRDYLSAFMKIGTIALLVVGVIVVNPELQMPAFTQFVAGGRPIIPGRSLPVRVHHDCLRRHLGLPRPDRIGHDAEDGGQGVGHPADRLRSDADRGPGRRRRADRCRVAAPRRLLRHQRVAEGLRHARHPGRESSRTRAGGG